MGQILSIIIRWLWGEKDDKKKPSEKLPLISPPKLGSDTNSSSSRPALQPNPITSPPSLGSCRDYTLQTNIRTHPTPPLSSSSNSSSSSSSSPFTHSKTSGASRLQPTLQTHHQLNSSSCGLSIATTHQPLNLSSCGLSSTTVSSPVQPKLETQQQLSSSSCNQSSTTHFYPKPVQTPQPLSSNSCGLSRPSGTSHAQPKIQTHPSLLSSSCSHSSVSGASHFQPNPVTLPLSSVPSSNSGASQRNSLGFPLSLDPRSNSRSDDALDLLIPAKFKNQVVGDEKQVSARLHHYNIIEENEERTRVVGKNWWDCSSCEEDLEEGKLRVRWIKHYSSNKQEILNYKLHVPQHPFGVCLMTLTDDYQLQFSEFLSTNYRHALSNIDKLRSLGAKVMHDVDATKMANVFPFKCMRFDRVVYNFPLAGFFPDEPREDEIWRHRMLVQQFLENAKKLIHIDGEIHITHKSNGFFYEWNLEFLASRIGLRLIEEVPFNFRDYPGYRSKYGFGGDNNFNCSPSKTYKFGHKKPIEKPSYRFMK
ncbi:Heavy metal-associated isoprenylated plant protein 41 [Vitis vinifera]|uniref:Heavy metal-associated isoprenylated plant protein 41 n=1 Tax=Vitis vinifera TaxID=29760 RepID=A0A438CPZ4_VITVI|nr:Heavy metal-associated isoprenylated plant protein 41 [Vitis vinifera]